MRDGLVEPARDDAVEGTRPAMGRVEATGAVVDLAPLEGTARRTTPRLPSSARDANLFPPATLDSTLGTLEDPATALPLLVEALLVRAAAIRSLGAPAERDDVMALLLARFALVKSPKADRFLVPATAVGTLEAPVMVDVVPSSFSREALVAAEDAVFGAEEVEDVPLPATPASGLTMPVFDLVLRGAALLAVCHHEDGVER